LRYAALSLGASIYFSSTKEGSLVRRIKELLVHHSFNSHPPYVFYFPNLSHRISKTLVCRKHVNQDVGKPLAVPCGVDSIQLIGGPGTTVNFKNAATAISRWKQTCLALYPSDDSGPVTINVDPARDPSYAEPEIDLLREQKDAVSNFDYKVIHFLNFICRQELNKYRQEVAADRKKPERNKK
jgi:dynein light intermediate chain 2, cytosolic